MRRRTARLGIIAPVLAVAIVVPLAEGCGGKKPNGAVAGATSVAASASPSARWRPVTLPLRRTGHAAVYPFPAASAHLRIDESGTRWLLPDPPPLASAPKTAPAVPVQATAIDLEPIEARLAMPDGDLLLVGRDGRVSKLASPLAQPTPALEARLPEGAVVSTLRRFRGATTVRAKGGLFWSGDGKRFVSVRSLSGYAPAEAILDGAGVGIGLFFPERVALTRDRGQTWIAVALPDAHVTQVDHRGERLVALPGGIRDTFARAIDPTSGLVERVSSVRSGGPLVAEEPDLATLLRLGPRPRGRPFSRPNTELAKPPPSGYVPAEEPRGFRRGPSLDGDTLLAFEEVHDNRGKRSLEVSTGLLGEPLSPFGEGTLASCDVRASALCGARAAIVCGAEVIHFRSGAETARTAVSTDTVVAYDAEGRLWTASPDREAGSSAILLRRFPLEGALPSPGEEHARVLGGTTPRFLGGCRAPGLWVVGETAAAKLHGTGFAPITPLPKDVGAVGVSLDGALVASTGGELVFLPGERRASVKAHLHHHIAFSEDGRHVLLSTPSGQLEQSDDGGHTFSPVATPPVLARQAVVCGRDRCQLGPSALREGFGRDPRSTEAAWPDPPRDDGSRSLHRRLAEKDRAKLPARDHLVCRSDEGSFRGAPTKNFAVRTGSFLFSSVSEGDADEPRGYFGLIDGKGEVLPLPPRAGGGERAGMPLSLAGGVGRAWLPPNAESNDPRAGRASVQWDPSAKPRLVVGQYPSVIAREDMWTSDGHAGVFADATAGELWSLGPDRDARRQLAVSRLPRFHHRGGHLGVWHVAHDAVWYGVFPSPPSADPDHVRTFSLVAAFADRTSDDRLVAVGTTSDAEIATGLLPEGDRVALVALERVEGTDEVELRGRALSPDLQLGEARAIPGTRGPSGRLLRLPTCAAGASGAIVRLDAIAPRRVIIDGRKAVGNLVRLARITPASACLERSYVVEDRDAFRPVVVVAGNEGVGFANEGGVRCTLAATPP